MLQPKDLYLLKCHKMFFCCLCRLGHDVFDRGYKAIIGVDFEVEKFSVFVVPFNLQM